MSRYASPSVDSEASEAEKKAEFSNFERLNLVTDAGAVSVFIMFDFGLPFG